MIEADSFIEPARELGFRDYTGVPCSFLTPFINYVINDASLNYISSTNEGDAVATAAGLALGGRPAVAMMQNSGLGNAVSPLTSLTWVFRIPVLLICTHRGAPGVNDEPQHELMGRITGDLFDTMQVPREIFPSEPEQVRPCLERAMAYMRNEQRPYALIMEKGTVAPTALRANSIPSRPHGGDEKGSFQSRVDLPTRRAVLERVIAMTPPGESIVLATTGYTGRELYALGDRDNQLYMVGSMGCASSLGLGLAMAAPDRTVVVIDGDGAALMRMGNLATLGTYGPANLVHILLDNGVHDSTGAQATVAPNVDFAAVAADCGYAAALRGDDISVIDELFTGDDNSGPRFAHIRIESGTMDNLPRPDITPEQVARRLMRHMGTAFI